MQLLLLFSSDKYWLVLIKTIPQAGQVSITKWQQAHCSSYEIWRHTWAVNSRPRNSQTTSDRPKRTLVAVESRNKVIFGGCGNAVVLASVIAVKFSQNTMSVLKSPRLIFLKPVWQWRTFSSRQQNAVLWITWPSQLRIFPFLCALCCRVSSMMLFIVD